MEKFLGEGLTFDDVLLIPRASSVLPRETNLATRLTGNITLNIPLMSSAMDTVTEAAMAMAIAREGGIGIIHKNMPIGAQAEQVDRVKRSESGMILDPVTMSPGQTVGEALETMRKYQISGIPIVSAAGKLVGILTNRDLRFQPKRKQKISEVMTDRNLVTAPVGTTLEKAESLLQQHKIEKLPVVDKNGILRGLITFKDIQKRKAHPSACKDAHGR
ncbi:MAG TPA: IMP dehydrogenase, partial [Bacteroidota bacterium]|nr:IMP dehydrogenase [Bacteroidota bacterium]